MLMVCEFTERGELRYNKAFKRDSQRLAFLFLLQI